ncbi:ABC-F family ATP-binding cassette domain-containing protein [Streptomyces griseoviridis]|jgi:ATPase subunit of ABC transporter with duplicated ATPase domains|uniref:ATPase subunit of ABC transporter with duplicated ATPase domains n=2 Tax=Streptomyces griseoviridis TaxID=45398 RepID=A0ABT9LPG1_STRGD|nr:MULTISPECIES: ABC-F family ATP-binding cassette domain-containing protein [Streptomyces]MDP9685423.1 ATPase subunit of ABC transporter with duplicated ATPase domains [Streptomyces griseoviridis]GGS33089.1 ABC transporter [Streptomyces niveoruber]GGS87285.1 ABC transporter [Streptomyces griseoviridis]
MPLSISCTALSFAWPDGTPVFQDLDVAFGPGRTGLVGVNGAGKSTLLKIIAGRLTPAGGTVRVAGETGYLPQNVTLDTALRVDEVLGIAARRAALHAIEAGDAAEEHFETLGDDWDVEERARATLGELGLGHIDLDRTVGEISGGESVLLRLAALLLRRPDVLLLDEPTNNLDLYARRRLYAAVAAWSGVLVVVSHDRELLDLVDQIADLRRTGPAGQGDAGGGEIVWYGGNFSAYEEALAVEQEAAERMVRAAESDLRKQQRELADAQVKLARRKRYGQKMYEQKREPKIVMGARRRAAQESAGKHRILHEERLAEARERLGDAVDAVRDDDEIRVDLPYTAVPPGRSVLTLRDLELAHGARVTGGLDLHGPERIALVGRNGAGKTTLLRTIAGELAPVSGEATAHVPLRFLPQRLDVLDDELTVAENVARFAPDATGNRVRARLARFLFRGARADQRAGTLSGGERFRAALAALMLAEPAPQLLLLDEPTNNLDMASVRQLTTALESYEGALIVAGHDLPFLQSLGITRWLLMAEGELTETTEEAVAEPA